MKSAETIPADVCALVVRVFHDMEDRGERLSLFGLMESAVMADRDTRPAEPAAPVAEAGSHPDAMRRPWELRSPTQIYGNLQRDQNGTADRVAVTTTHADATLIVEAVNAYKPRLSTLEAERARAAQAEADLHEVEEQFAKLQEAEAQAEEEACLRVAAEASLSRVLQDRDFWKERFQVESRSRIQAEQRAADALASIKELEFGAGFEAAFGAVVRPGSRYENWTPADDPAEIVTDLYNDLEDALARAEKAEGAGADDRRRLDWLEANTSAVISHEGFEDDVWQIHTVSGNRSDLEWTKRAEADTVREAIDAAIRAIPPRASREAQPSTDGGDNG